MKAGKTIIASIAALLLAAGANAQEFHFGIKGGVAANWMPGTSITFISGLPVASDRVLTNVGFYGGIVGNVEFNGSFFPQIELLYTRKGITTNNDVFGKYVRNISYIQMPVLAGFKMADDRLRIMIGPEVALCVGEKIKYGNEFEIDPSSNGPSQKFNLAAAFQITYLIAGGFGVDAKFDYGITRTLQDEKDNGRNMSVQLGFCYLFGE